MASSVDIFFSWKSDCQGLFSWRYREANIPQSSDINTTDTSLWSKIICLWAFQELQPRIKPSHATFARKKKRAMSLTLAPFVPVCHFGDILYLRLLPQLTTCLFHLSLSVLYLFYLKSNLLRLAKNNLHNPQGVTVRPFVMLQDWYWAACPVTCAINFSSKVKLGPCCLHMSYISNSFDTNGTTLRASCAREVCFVFLNRVCVVFSSVPLSPSAIIYHTAVFNFLPHGCLFY